MSKVGENLAGDDRALASGSLTAANTSNDGSASARVRPHKICLFGMFGGGNFGNDASLESFLYFLREARPDADISCICVDPDAVSELHHIPTAAISAPESSSALLKLCNKISLKTIGRLMNWQRAIQQIKQYDIVIVPGTSTLNDYGSGPFGTSYGLFRWVAAARLTGVKFCFVGTGAGPILHPLSRSMLKSAAAWAYYRSFRDQVSKDFLTSIGIDTSNDKVYPDLVFKLPVPSPQLNSGNQRPLTIGVGLMNHNGWLAGPRAGSDSTIYKTYVGKIGQFVKSLLDRGFRVRLLIGETVDRQAVDDVGLIAQAAGYTLSEAAPPQPEAKQLIAEPINSLHDIMRQVNDTDIVVATRYHNVVSALKLGRPTISIGYEAKNDAVMSDFGLEEFCQAIEDLDLEKLQLQFSRILENRELYQETVQKNLAATLSRVKQHEQELLSRII
jgi:polysaccharide pyruvyl transferase WcaK-like protein